jgi:hypothetical protein
MIVALAYSFAALGGGWGGVKGWGIYIYRQREIYIDRERERERERGRHRYHVCVRVHCTVVFSTRTPGWAPLLLCYRWGVRGSTVSVTRTRKWGPCLSRRCSCGMGGGGGTGAYWEDYEIER